MPAPCKPLITHAAMLVFSPLCTVQEKMAECRIVDKLAKFVPVRNDVLLMSVLRLLHNLSFDVALRDDMVKNLLIAKVRNARGPARSRENSSVLYPFDI